MATAEQAWEYRDNMARYEPEKYLELLRKAREREAQKRRKRIAARLASLRSNPPALAAYRARLKGGMRGAIRGKGRRMTKLREYHGDEW
jgi:hypothetical protein